MRRLAGALLLLAASAAAPLGAQARPAAERLATRLDAETRVQVLAEVEAALPFPTPASGTYSVNVHASPTQMGTIVACADLRPGTM